MDNLQTGLISIIEANGKQAVNARDLHAFLGTKRDFSTWIKDRIDKYDFVENQDYQTIKFDSPNLVNQKRGGDRRSIEYALSISMAKELSMIENNDRGKQARKYFIACESKLMESKNKALPENYLEALKALVESEEKKQALELENKKLAQANQHNRDVIDGLVNDIPLADMRQRIVQIVQKGGVHYVREDWNKLYFEFEKKYHMNLSNRKKFNLSKGSKMDFIDKELKMIPELYDLACKLFESRYDALMEDWGKFAKRATRYN